jgi:hypothetical protein
MSAYRSELQLTAAAVRALAEFGKALHERNLFILDLTTENLFSDPEAGLKVIDLEFLQEYREPVRSLAQCYTFRGVPEALRDQYDAPLDVPLTGGRVGNQVFHPAVSGLPVRAFLRPERPSDEFRRTATQLAWFAYFGVARPSRGGAVTLLRSRWGRRAKTGAKLLLGRGNR